MSRQQSSRGDTIDKMLLFCFSVRLSGHVCTRLADCDTLDQAAADGVDMSALV